MELPNLDAASAAEYLQLPAEQAAWVRSLERAGPVGELRLPPLPEAPEVLRRLAVAPDDADEILEGWPPEQWPAELVWLLERVVAVVRAEMGGVGWLEPGPSLPRDRGLAWKHFYVYAYLALLESVLAYHKEHGVPETVSWTTLGDLGRKLSIDRQMSGEAWPTALQWLTLHVRGGVYELGRLQFQRCHRPEAVGDDALSPGDFALALHIPESGPLTPERCDESFQLAREFFPRHFPDEPYQIVTCDSWLLDPQFAEYLPPGSNIIRFQRRFQLVPGGGEGNESILRFVFHTLTTPLDKLPQQTTLERAVSRTCRPAGAGKRGPAGPPSRPCPTRPAERAGGIRCPGQRPRRRHHPAGRHLTMRSRRSGQRWRSPGRGWARYGSTPATCSRSHTTPAASWGPPAPGSW